LGEAFLGEAFLEEGFHESKGFHPS
jgi:hypothetical protein